MTEQGADTCLDHPGERSVPAELAAVSLEMFRTSEYDCDTYISYGLDNRLKLYRKKSRAVTSADLDRLAERGITQLYISQADQNEHRRVTALEVCKDTTRRPSERYRILREVNKATFNIAYHGGDINQVVGIVEDVGVQLSGVLTDGDLVLKELLSLMDHNDDIYSHSVNVATYTVLLAKFLGVSDDEHLCSIMVGGLMHDLGKRYLDLAILKRRDDLNLDERRKMEQHPRLGFKDLALREDLTWEQLMMVYQHHERIDGRGYPVGLRGSEIHHLAKVTMIADVFHALTSIRLYRQPMSAEQACGFLTQESGTMFDPEMIRCWNSKMKAGVCV